MALILHYPSVHGIYILTMVPSSVSRRYFRRRGLLLIAPTAHFLKFMPVILEGLLFCCQAERVFRAGSSLNDVLYDKFTLS